MPNVTLPATRDRLKLARAIAAGHVSDDRIGSGKVVTRQQNPRRNTSDMTRPSTTMCGPRARELADAGLAAAPDGETGPWRLTEAGKEWLAQHDGGRP